MVRLLRSLLVLAPVLAAADSVLVRLAFPWRSAGPELFLQALLVWAAFGLLALWPAARCLAWLERNDDGMGDDGAERGRAAPTVLLLAWMAVPVVLHGTIDRHLGLQGNIAALKRADPWIELTLTLGASAVVLWTLTFVLRRFPARPLALAAVAGALISGPFLPLRSRPSAPSVQAAAGDERPNLLLMIWDTCRPDHLEPYGHDRPTTPYLAALAEEAVVFENVVSASCFTLTSHFSILTGVYPSTHGARLMRSRFNPRKTELITEHLRRSGYRTGAFVGTDVLAGRTDIRRGFEVYDDAVDPPVCSTYAWGLVHDVQAFLALEFPALNQNGLPHWIQDFQRPASEVLASALAWIEEDDPRPWFAMVNLYDVHWPYLPGEEGRALVTSYDGPMDGYLFRSNAWQKGYGLDAADRRHVVELYEGEILDLDREVDTFLRELELERGGTALVLTSDHGEAFGEAGRWKHEDITEPQVRVPLLIRLPESAPRGRRVSEPASGVDVGPTLLGLAGLGPLEGFEGIDLLDGELSAERLVRVEDRDHIDPWDIRIALYRGHWKLVRWGLGAEVRYELYDLTADSVGEHDVAAEHPDVLAELMELMAAERLAGDAADGLTGGKEATDQADALRALGYGGR